MKLNELSPEAQERAYQDWARDEPHYDWWDIIYEMKIEEGKEKGFEIQNISFSGFSSQGDGASWQGYILLPEFLDWADKQDPLPLSLSLSLHQINLIRAAAENNLCETSIKISTRGSYCHEMTMFIEYGGFSLDYFSHDVELKTGFFAGMIEQDFEALVAQHYDEIDKALLEAARDFARGIYKALEDEHEYLTSEDHFREMAESNEWEFNEEGEME